MSRILHCRLSRDIGEAVEFLRKWKLAKYSNAEKDKPVVFFGLYGEADLHRLSIHNPDVLSVVVWAGSDILDSDMIDGVKKLKNIKHVAISSFIARDLEKAGLSYKFIPLAGFNPNPDIFSPLPLGSKIYTYIPPNRYKFYGGKVIEKLRKKCKHKIIVTNGYHHYDQKELIKIYSRCFCGLRLTPHDGLSNTVVELGYMGRRSVYNGDVPGAIKWDKNDISGILDNIASQSKNIGKTDEPLSNEWKKYLDVKDDWLYEEYWR